MIVDYVGIWMKNCNCVKYEYDEVFFIENNF